MDFHHDGKVNYSEFLAAALSSLVNYQIIKNFYHEEKLWTVFKSFDKTDKGYVTSDSIIETLKTNNITVNEVGLREFFEKNQKISTRLNFEEFKLLIEEEKLIK
jgi:Ca2+-binding EF-hand superfamily protein